MGITRWHRVVTLPLAAVAIIACGGRQDGTSSPPGNTAGNTATTGDAESNATGGASGSSDTGPNEAGYQSFERRCPEAIPVATLPCGPNLCEVLQADPAELAADCVFHSPSIAHDALAVGVLFDCLPQPTQTLDGSLQWMYFDERNASRIEFYAETCAAIRARSIGVIDVTFGCPICQIM